MSLLSLLSLLAIFAPASCMPAARPAAPRRPPSRHAVLWDLDGTLCDSFRLAFDATQDVLAQHGHAPVSEAEYHSCTRYCTPERMARHLGLQPGDESFDRVGRELGSEFDALYISKVSPHTAPLFEEAAELARRLGRAGVPQAVLTNAAVAYAEAVLTAHGLRELFAVVHGADSVPSPKPRPDGVLRCLADLRALGLLASPAEGGQGAQARCAGVYIGDSPSDGEAARLAGLASVGVAWGSHSAASLSACGHFDLLCAQPAHLERALLGRADGVPSSRAAFLLDRDGVLNVDVGHPGVLHERQLQLLPTAASALGLLRARGHPTALVTNQKCVGDGLTTEAQVDATHARLRALLLAEEPTAQLGPIFAAYNRREQAKGEATAEGEGAPEAKPPAPKPAPDLLLRALAALGCQPEHALMIGDARTDAQAAAACGVRFALVTSSAHGEEAAAEVCAGIHGAAAADGAGGGSAQLALKSGAPIGGGVHPHVLAAVSAELARADREGAEACLRALAGAADARIGAQDATARGTSAGAGGATMLDRRC